MPLETSSESVVAFHPLRFKDEGDGKTIVGCLESDKYIILPSPVADMIRAVDSGTSLEEAAREFHLRNGKKIDTEGLVGKLAKLGFTRESDQPAGTWDINSHGHLRWLTEQRSAWLIRHHFQAMQLALFILGSALFWHLHLGLSWRWYFVFGRPGLDVAINTTMFFGLVVLHEISHLIAARAGGAAARFGVGVRLIYPVAETRISGLWLASRRDRLRAFCAGMLSDLAMAGVAAMSLYVAIHAFGLAETQLIIRVLRALILAVLVSLLGQFSVFIRTDLYFVLQEALKCRNLYADSWSVIRHSLRLRKSPRWQTFEHRERIAVPAYAVFMLVCTAITLTQYVTIGIPVAFNIYKLGIVNLWNFKASPGATLLDSALLVAFHAVFDVLLVVNAGRWVRKSVSKVRA